jgi:hypothetical protein
VLAACGEHSPTTSVAPPPPSVSTLPRNAATAATATATCPTARSLAADVVALFAKNDKVAAAAQLSAAMVVIGTTPVLNSPLAQKLVLGFISFVLKRYWAGQLNGGMSTTTQQEVVDLVNGLLCWIGLPQTFTLASLSSDGAAAVLTPSTPDTTVVTGTKFAGVHVDSGTVTQPVLVTITRLPDSSGPLLTHLDQYPIFYEFSVTPDTASLAHLVTVGVCLANSAQPPNPTRLRVAHNVAPDTMGSIEILPLAPAPFLDCTNADVIIGAGSANPFANFALKGWRAVRPVLQSLLLPEPLHAATSGVGGTAGKFSPFGLVDTLLMVTPNSSTSQQASAGTTVPSTPSVMVKTPAGTPYSGLPVTFQVTAGGGSLTGASTKTGTDGIATAGSWTLGTSPGLNTVTATAPPPYPQHTDVMGSPVTFTATALAPTQLGFQVGPATVTAGATMAPAVQVAVEDQNGNVVTSSSAPVTLSLSGNATLGGTLTVNAVNGIATFTDLNVTVAGTYTLTASSGALTPATSSPFTVTSGAAAQIAIWAGNGQTTKEYTKVPIAPAARVTDAYGNPVSGVTVTFAPKRNSGSVTYGVQITDGNGVATVGSWKIVEEVNYLVATARASNVAGNPVTFVAYGTEH